MDYLDTRKKYIKKKNEIIQKTRSTMTAYEQKLFAYSCLVANELPKEAIKLGSPLKITFKAKSFFDYYGIAGTGADYEYLKNTLYDLRHITMQIQDNGRYVAFGFIDRGLVNENNECEITIGEDVIPYITGIDENSADYTKIPAYEYSKIKGKYTIKLYEYFLSRHDKQIGKADKRSKKEREMYPLSLDIVLKLDDLKEKLMIEKLKSYAQYKRFNSKILKPAIEEINAFTDIYVTYKPQGRPTNKIMFSISKKAIIDAE